jgi:hypothetical protein
LRTNADEWSVTARLSVGGCRTVTTVGLRELRGLTKLDLRDGTELTNVERRECV